MSCVSRRYPYSACVMGRTRLLPFSESRRGEQTEYNLHINPFPVNAREWANGTEGNPATPGTGHPPNLVFMPPRKLEAT